MTKPDNNQPLIRFYANKNVKKYVLTGLVINTLNYSEYFNESLNLIILKNPMN